MARIKITKANEVHELHVATPEHKAVVPIDGGFHEIHDSLLPVLDDSAVEYEQETSNADATSGSAVSGRRAKAGGSKRAAKPKGKAKK